MNCAKQRCEIRRGAGVHPETANLLPGRALQMYLNKINVPYSPL